MASGPPGRADGRVGRAGPGSPSPILSAALARYVLCMKCAGRDPRPSTPSAPLASPPEPAVSVRARQTPAAGDQKQQANQP